MCRHEICQRIYKTIISGQKFYTVEVHKLWQIWLTMKQRKCIDISNISDFMSEFKNVRFQQFQCKITLFVNENLLLLLYKKRQRCFLETSTQLAQILHGPWSRRPWQISSLRHRKLNAPKGWAASKWGHTNNMVSERIFTLQDYVDINTLIFLRSWIGLGRSCSLRTLWKLA